VAVYSVDGRRLRELVNGEMPAGMSEVTWDGRDAEGRSVSSGLYFCRLHAVTFTDMWKMVLLRFGPGKSSNPAGEMLNAGSSDVKSFFDLKIVDGRL
jgi:hypothetical protein